MNDLALALRFVRRSPGLAAAAIISLALGIGVSSAVFTVVEALLLKPLPFAGQEELVYATETAGADHALNAVSGPDLLDWRERAKSFRQLAGFRRTALTLTGAGPAERIDAAAIESGVFAALRVSPLRGRMLDPRTMPRAARAWRWSRSASCGRIDAAAIESGVFAALRVSPLRGRMLDPRTMPRAARAWRWSRSASCGRM